MGVPDAQSSPVSGLRDWSLITGRGGGGACEVLPL